MDVLSFVGSSLLSAAYDTLLEKLKGYLSDRLWNSDEEVRDKMKDWKTLLPKITAVLQLAEENQVANLFVKSYLDDLRDLAYDMEDLLEEFVIDAKSSELVAESEEAGASKRQKITSGFVNLFTSKAKPNREINSMVDHLNVKLQRIVNQMGDLGLINLALKLGNKSHKVAAKRLPEFSLLEDKVWGRDSAKDEILRRLLGGGSLEQDFVIPIVGMGGLGKTTLARLLYNDEKLEGKFDLKAWVCVSDEFDVARITRTILEHVTGKRCDFDSGLLQEKLKEKLSGRKFFLVLDDVWNEEYGQWDVLKRPFMSGAPGSKIIVTTRNKGVGVMMRGDDGVHNLDLLQDDDCLPLFTWHALGKENFDAHPDLRDVGEELVKRCKRLPLALKTLGGVLRGKLRREEWENILNSEIWSLSKDRSGILPALRLSYNDLPSHLKRCFAYCALFPKDYEFDKKELVLLWMAEGLLQQQSRGKKQMEEDIGYQYFQELLSRSLFQQSSRVESRFVMHDLINDLAVDVAGEINCNLDCSMGDEKLEKARHLAFTPHFYEFSERFKVLEKLKHFRTFLSLRALDDYPHFHLSNKILHEFLPTLNRLRVLSLYNYQISKLPDFFEKLRHIWYINLSGTKIKCLPESVGSLLFLQTLLLCRCHELAQLPTTIGNLIDLHHLDITDTLSLKEMPSEIGKLKNLVTLSKFIVGKAMRLSALKNLSQLRGRLSILDLQMVSDVQDAAEANLDKIHGLEELVLDWKWDAPDSDRHESILSRLKPHSKLESLEISHYGGRSFPNWFCDSSLFLKLSSMELNCCQRCNLLPSFGLLPVLKKLIIKGMSAIEAVGTEFYGGRDSFPKLEELVFERMSNWKEWTSPAGSEGEFRRLRRLVIEGCPKLLGQLPSNLSSLKELDVSRCNGALFKSMVDLASLTKLRIYHITELTCLPSMVMSRLEKLEIWGCDSLKSFPRGKLPITVKYLRIKDCKGLESLPDADGDSNSNLHLEIDNVPCLYSSEGCHQLLAFLKEFTVRGCEQLESFPARMLQHCTGLQSISINNYQILKSLPTLHCISSLIKLSISECHALETLPEQLGLWTPNLRDLLMVGCKNFKSLPNTMYQLKSLQRLYMDRCPSIEFIPDGGLPPNLTELELRCKNLKSVPNTMYQLTSLQTLWIPGGALTMRLQTLTSLQKLKIQQKFPQDIVLPSSLTSLAIRTGENLESIPGGLFQNLSSLEELQIINCPKLQSLPKEAFRPSLGRLCIWGCPHLKQRFEENGDYWTFTWNIPDVDISELEVKASMAIPAS